MPDVLMIDNHAFPARPKSTASNQTYRQKENLVAAYETLEELRQRPVPAKLAERYGIDGWQAWLMFLRQPVAVHYGLDREAVYTAWSEHYLPGIVASHEAAVVAAGRRHDLDGPWTRIGALPFKLDPLAVSEAEIEAIVRNGLEGLVHAVSERVSACTDGALRPYTKREVRLRAAQVMAEVARQITARPDEWPICRLPKPGGSILG